MGYDPRLIDLFTFLGSFGSLFDDDVIAGEAIALGFEHYVLALGTAVMIPSFLVPMMGGDDVSNYFYNFLNPENLSLCVFLV